MLVNFDAPDTLTSVSRRERSNTPLQALDPLNDPVFQEAADALAYRVLRDGPASFADRLGRLSRWCLNRPPSAAETVLARRFHSAQLERFKVR